MPVQKQIAQFGIVFGDPPSPTVGDVIVKATPTADPGSPDVRLSGSGTGWRIEPPEEVLLGPTDHYVLHLEPTANQSLPVRYQLTLKLDPSSQPSFSFKGVQIYHFDPADSSFERVSIFFPASPSQAQISFLHNIPPDGQSVTYGMSIGLLNGSVTSWDYPTISFDPQAGPPAM